MKKVRTFIQRKKILTLYLLLATIAIGTNPHDRIVLVPGAGIEPARSQ